MPLRRHRSQIGHREGVVVDDGHVRKLSVERVYRIRGSLRVARRKIELDAEQARLRVILVTSRRDLDR